MTETAYRHAIASSSALRRGWTRSSRAATRCCACPASGIAPEGLGWTGHPIFNAFWTYAGTPCVSLPLLEIDGMPLGVQLTGRRGGDGPLLRTARWLDKAAA